MKTINTTITEKLNVIYGQRDRYYAIRKEMDKLKTPEQGNEWNNLYEQTIPIKKEFKRSVTELATLLGFSVNEGFFKPSFANYEKILSTLIVRWATSQSVLHRLNELDKEFLTNAEYPYRPQD